MTLQPIGKREKALIHVAKAQLSLTEDEYRGLLSSVGVSSSTELNYQSFDELMDKLRACGFRPLGKTKRASGMHSDLPKEKQPMLSKIGAILEELNMPSKYADGVAKKMFGVESLRWCTTDQTWKVLQAFIIFQNRKKVA
ncbi:MAG: phage protein GemA/Gp16 family protein [Syntrophobacteraceae bacterium]